MKNTIKYITAAFAIGTMLLTSSCQVLPANIGQYNTPAVVQSSVAVATQLGLSFGFKDGATRTMVANYVDVYAAGLRTITGTPTTAELMTELNSFIPLSIQAKYPSIAAFATPLIVSAYQVGYDKYKGNVAETYAYFNAVATGFETGAAGYITKK